MKILKIPLLTIALFICLQGKSQQKETDKIQAANKVLVEFSNMKEKIPQKLFSVTEGIIIVPKLLNAGFVIAGKRGKGIAMVKNADGTWSDPVFVTITGGSIGFQVGVQSVDLVLIFKNRETLQKIGTGSFTLGGDASVTAGPVGRNSSVSTDYKMDAEIYSYSKSKGLFAGISISGSALDIDEKANSNFYGEAVDAETIFGNNRSSSADVIAIKQTLSNLFR
ncbi:MAG TPA: lipid-binding SYLF domain-containing protein [Chitinophagaceae bacterium]